jgi:hypothetical protein
VQFGGPISFVLSDITFKCVIGLNRLLRILKDKWK